MGFENITCFECGAIIEEGEARHFDEQVLCPDCLERLTVICECCNNRVWRECAEIDDNYTLCERCYEHGFSSCTECNRIIPNGDTYYMGDDDEEGPYCYDCFTNLNERCIKNYSYKPEPIFYGEPNTFFYGVELEVDKGGEDCENAKALLDFANAANERIYIKHDGSLSNGFELVSHPMSLDYHMKEMPWKELMKKAVDMNYRSHDTCTCGLHIHINRSAFGKTFEEQEKCIKRLVYFFEKHWCELVNFSRRTTENLERWAARYATISTTAEETYEKAKGKYMGRYCAVNLSNMTTVECRIFRGTLRCDSFIATLQLVDEICKIALNFVDFELERMSWLDFVQMIPDEKEELINYLKGKRLYVNEINAESEEF